MAAARMNNLPPGVVVCGLCGHGQQGKLADGSLRTRCVNCGCSLAPEESTVGRSPARPRGESARNRRGAQRIKPLSTTPTGHPILGIDPGARYTALVIRDGDAVLHSTTLKRADDTDQYDWVKQVVTFALELRAANENLPVGVEGVSEPKGFKHGEKASLNPGHIMRAALVVGGVLIAFPDAIVIPPGGNGSQHTSHYPEVLRGRRNKDLPGSTDGSTRAHEQSAYDVAGKAAAIAYAKTAPPLAESFLAVPDREITAP